MTWFDLLTDLDEQGAMTGRLLGVVPALVTNNSDPEGLGRVKVQFRWLNDQVESNWARVSTPMAGKERGFYCLPEVGDEVLVAFAHSDIRVPYVLGALWSKPDKPPAKNDDGKNKVRLWRSRSGHTIRLDDTEGAETIEIIDKSGKNTITIDAVKNEIIITSDGNLTLSASKGTLKLEAQQIELKATTAAKIEANTNLDIKAQGALNQRGNPINLN